MRVYGVCPKSLRARLRAGRIRVEVAVICTVSNVGPVWASMRRHDLRVREPVLRGVLVAYRGRHRCGFSRSASTGRRRSWPSRDFSRSPPVFGGVDLRGFVPAGLELGAVTRSVAWSSYRRIGSRSGGIPRWSGSPAGAGGERALGCEAPAWGAALRAPERLSLRSAHGARPERRGRRAPCSRRSTVV